MGTRVRIRRGTGYWCVRGGQRLVLELGGWARNMDSVDGDELGARWLDEKWNGKQLTSGWVTGILLLIFGSGLRFGASVRDFGSGVFWVFSV